MKTQLIKNMSLFSKVLLGSISFLTVLCVIFSACSIVIFMLNENQLLYLFSAMAQVIGGIFGLTLTAYVFFVDKFKESAKDDDALYDATTAILNRYFQNLILLAVTCGVIIFFCIMGIIDLHNWMVAYSFVINESVCLFLIGIVATLSFGTMLLDPGKLDKEIRKMKKGAEVYYQIAEDSVSGDFLEFLRTYNQLEQLVIEFAKECMKDWKDYRYNYKPQIIQSLKVLNLREIVNYNLLNEINELRMYRNALVHGVDFDVTRDVCVRIAAIYKELKNAFDAYKNNGLDSEEWNEAVKNVYSLSR